MKQVEISEKLRWPVIPVLELHGSRIKSVSTIWTKRKIEHPYSFGVSELHGEGMFRWQAVNDKQCDAAQTYREERRQAGLRKLLDVGVRESGR